MAQKDYSQLFFGMVVFLSLVYYAIMFWVLKDTKSVLKLPIYETNQMGEKRMVSKGDQLLEPLNID